MHVWLDLYVHLYCQSTVYSASSHFTQIFLCTFAIEFHMNLYKIAVYILSILIFSVRVIVILFFSTGEAFFVVPVFQMILKYKMSKLLCFQ